VLAVDNSEIAIANTAERLSQFGEHAMTVVISRFVLMLLDDPISLLRGVRRELNPKGKDVFMV
jgi:hypothetical protein